MNTPKKLLLQQRHSDARPITEPSVTRETVSTAALEVTARQEEKHNRAALGLFELSAAGLGSAQRD